MRANSRGSCLDIPAVSTKSSKEYSPSGICGSTSSLRVRAQRSSRASKHSSMVSRLYRLTSSRRRRMPIRQAAISASRSPWIISGKRELLRMNSYNGWFSWPAWYNLDGRNDQSLLKNLRRVQTHAAGFHAAHIVDVSVDLNESNQLIVPEGRGGDADIGKMGNSAALVGVIPNENVPLLDLLGRSPPGWGPRWRQKRRQRCRGQRRSKTAAR